MGGLWFKSNCFLKNECKLSQIARDFQKILRMSTLCQHGTYSTGRNFMEVCFRQTCFWVAICTKMLQGATLIGIFPRAHIHSCHQDGTIQFHPGHHFVWDVAF